LSVLQRESEGLLGDSRFAKMFADPAYEVDATSEEYQLLQPLVSRLDKHRAEKQQKQQQQMLDAAEQVQYRLTKILLQIQLQNLAILVIGRENMNKTLVLQIITLKIFKQVISAAQ
jgi:hypothetical protein